MRWVGNFVYEVGYLGYDGSIEFMDLGFYFGVWFVRYLSYQCFSCTCNFESSSSPDYDKLLGT
jgi:hypothetical protein